MFCPNCGKEVSDTMKFCPYCGCNLEEILGQVTADTEPAESESSQEEDIIDPFYGCGEEEEKKEEKRKPAAVSSKNSAKGKSKSGLLAGVLAIFLGYLGIHNFYLGRYRNAVVQLLLSIVSVLGVTLLAPTVGNAGQVWSYINGGLSLIAFIYVTLWILFDLIRIATRKIDSPKASLKVHKYDKYIFIALVLIIVCSFAVPFSNEMSKYNPTVREVRESIYSGNVTYDEMINSLLANQKWEAVSDNIVNVTGLTSFMGKDMPLAVGFKIGADGHPTVYAMELNGTPQNELWIEMILDRMYELSTTAGIMR